MEAFLGKLRLNMKMDNKKHNFKIRLAVFFLNGHSKSALTNLVFKVAIITEKLQVRYEVFNGVVYPKMHFLLFSFAIKTEISRIKN